MRWPRQETRGLLDQGGLIQQLDLAGIERRFEQFIEGGLRLADRLRFSELIGWPPNVRNQHVIELVVSFLTHAIDMMFWDQEAALRKAVSKSLFKQIEGWSTTREKIAPYLYNRIIDGVVLH